MSRVCASVEAGTRRADILGLAPPPTRHAELGAFLRHRREATPPDAVGLATNGHRRTPGLRREEVSQLAGVGLSWYTWLEQGREITPSPSVLDALARLFDLDAAEHDHLFHLAGVAVPVSAGDYPTQAPPELAAVVHGLAPNPAYLLGPRTDVLAWNRTAAGIYGVPGPAPDGRPNLLWWLFTAPGLDEAGRAATARATLARFRAEHARRWGDPGFVELVRALRAHSPWFRELWQRHEVLESQLGTKTMAHAELGRLVLHHLQSIPTSHPDLRLIQSVPGDDATRGALAAL